MKKNLLCLTWLFAMLTSAAQNVGIGDATPLAKLSVAGSESTTHGYNAAIKLQNTAATNSWFLRAGASGTGTPENGFSIADNSGYHLIIGAGGNVGIGINPTTAKLHINGDLRLQGLSLLEFGAGVAGKEINAGKIGYNAFGANGLVFVGGGTNTSNRKVFFFAEGGSTFTGPVNVAGQIQLNGNPGSVGQVLTSNGATTPAWQNQAYGNVIRFGVQLQQNAGSTSGNCKISSTQYNTSPANIVIGTNGITLNHTGLYHFDVGLQGHVTYAAAATLYPQFGLWLFAGYGNSFDLANERVMASKSTANTTWYADENGSIEVFVTAPANISVYHVLGSFTSGSTVSFSATGFITGHLISD
jgi:hypothetical protein